MTTIETNHPKLILHFDVNKTLINIDSVTGKTAEEILINQLAEDTIYQWDPHHPEMTYKSYVKSVIVPGDQCDPAVRKKRREVISKFLETVKDYPEITKKVHENYRQLKEKAVDSVFPSFVKLVEKLKEQQLPFIIILRTFGNDLKEVEKEVFKKTGVFFSKRGEFKEGVLHLKGDESQTIVKTSKLFKFFSSSQEHIGIQDSYHDWNSNGVKAMFGKKFVFDRGDLDRKVTHLSFFFDDNLKGDPVKDIVAPFTQDGTFVPTDALVGKILFPVHTGQAILNENYYIDLVNEGLKVNGYQTLEKTQSH